MTKRPTTTARLPFGMRFLEIQQTREGIAESKIAYDERLNCTVVLERDVQRTPFVQAVKSCIRTQTITETEEEPEEASEEHGFQLRHLLVTVTETKMAPEGPDESDEGSITPGRVW